MKYNKLVRDKIPDIIRSKGQTAVIRIAGKKEYWLKLKEKLLEEVNEFIESEDHAELADIHEVLDAIYEVKGTDFKNIKAIQRKKAKERGGFKKRIILEES